jgi:hypothetical protein
MKTLQFESVKVALKQDKTGYVLTLCLHPDEIPEELLRDYVGARYQVVMVRLSTDETPMDRGEFDGQKAIRVAGLLCRDPSFWDWLHEDTQIIEAKEEEATPWLRDFLGVLSRSELKVNREARDRLEQLHKDFNAWKRK